MNREEMQSILESLNTKLKNLGLVKIGAGPEVIQCTGWMFRGDYKWYVETWSRGGTLIPTSVIIAFSQREDGDAYLIEIKEGNNEDYREIMSLKTFEELEAYVMAAFAIASALHTKG